PPPNRFRQLVTVPAAVPDRAFSTALYGTHPYGHLAIGTIDALETMALDEVVAFQRRWFLPSRAVLVVVGDAPHAEVAADASRAFAHWGEAPQPREGGATGSVLADPDSSGHRLLLVDRPGAAQSERRIGGRARARPAACEHAVPLL